jgi:hypothetical protein
MTCEGPKRDSETCGCCAMGDQVSHGGGRGTSSFTVDEAVVVDVDDLDGSEGSSSEPLSA